MNLKFIFKEFCGGLKDVESASKKFADLKTDEDRFEMAYDLSRDFFSCIEFGQLGKCATRSKQMRENGNERYNRKLFWDSLTLYSESVASAPIGSVEFALALGNRGACLLRLGYPEEALKDVQDALASLPAESSYREKLESRKEKCLNGSETEKSKLARFGFETLRFPKEKNDYLECAVSEVRLTENELSGRCLTATEDVGTGRVLIVEKPFSSILLPGSYYTHCSNCFKRAVRLLPCRFCSCSMYCSQKCLERSQVKNHKIECFVLGVLVGLDARRMELLSLRILLEASEQGENLQTLASRVREYDGRIGDRYSSAEHVTVYNLVGNTDKRSVADLFYRASVACILVKVLERFTNLFEGSNKSLKIFSGGLILRYMQSLPCNAHEISEFRENGPVEIGAAVYPALSLINHSCDPNVVRFCHGDRVVLRAVRPIKAGQEIVDNYGYHYATHEINERQSALYEQYHFRCECKPCAGLWPLYDRLPEENPVFKPGVGRDEYDALTGIFQQHLDAVFGGNFDDSVVDRLCSYLNFLDSSVLRPWKPYNKCQEAIKYCWSTKGNHFYH